MGTDHWQEDARTDRAIELLRGCRAKTNADGEVVPAHRYSRNYKHIAAFLSRLEVGGRGTDTVTISCSRFVEDGRSVAKVIATFDITDGKGNEWTQEGVACSDEKSADWYALALCRAFLQYSKDDGTPMTPDEVITMLEAQRAESLEFARKLRSSA